MLNQGQGTYPQLAGSFYNSQQMMPHDNGRNARQVPTFFGGLQNMMSASSAMSNYQNIPLGQNILNTQMNSIHQYGRGVGTVLGGIGTGLGVAGMVGGIASVPAVQTALGGGALATGLGLMGGVFGVGVGLGAMGIVQGYKKRMAAIDEMREALEGSRLGYGLSDPITGSLSNTAALQLSRQMESATRGAGFKKFSDMKQVMGTASGLGMLNGMQSLGQVTKRVVDLAKASREIVMLGEGITMTDAMNLQKLTQDMGISTGKFRGMNIGKNLVMAARAANMSMDQAAQVGGMGAMTFQQAGLGAASGMNAAFYNNMAASGLVGVGAFSTRQLAALGGQQGVAQSLLGGQASTMARMSDALVMGAVKLDASGQFRMDRELLDRYVRGDVSREDLIRRGKNLGKGMSKFDRNQLLEELQFSMPQLRESMSDMLSSEEMMAIQARGIQDLRNRTGMSYRRATHAYFQDASQAEAFLGYANNYDAVRAESNRQNNLAQQESMLRYAGMAKSSGIFSRGGRAFAEGISDFGSIIASPFTSVGEYFAEQVTRYQDDLGRGMRRMMGVGTGAVGAGDLRNAGEVGNLLFRRGAGRRSTISGYKGYEDYFIRKGSRNLDLYMLDTDQAAGINVAGGDGLGQRMEEYEEGDYNPLRKFGDITGIDNIFSDGTEIFRKQARATDQAILMGNLMRDNSKFSMSDGTLRTRYYQIVGHLRAKSMNAAKGIGSGDFYGVDSSVITPEKIRRELKYHELTSDQREQFDIALGEAYRHMSTNETGESRAGFSKMQERLGRVSGLEFLTDRIGGERDTIKLANGATLNAEGLSRAVHMSGVSSDNLGLLIKAYSGQGRSIIGEGATKNSVQTILAMAGITGVSTRQMGRYRDLLNVLEQGQVTTGTGDDQKTQSLIGANISLDDLAVRNLDQVQNAYIRDQLTNLDNRILGNLGAGNIREALIGGMVTDEGLDQYIIDESAYMDRGKLNRLNDAKKLELKRLAAEKQKLKKIIREGTTSDIGAGPQGPMTTTTLSNVAKRAQILLKGVQDSERRIKGEGGAGLSRVETDEILARYRENLDKTRLERLKSDPSALGRYKEGYYGTQEGLLGAGGDGTLSSLLEGLGTNQKEKDAYLKLLEGQGGAELMTTFQELRSKAAAAKTGAERERLDKQLIQAIVEAADKKKIPIPGRDQSESLPSLLKTIAEGVGDFRKAMKKIASLSQDGKKVTFELESK